MYTALHAAAASGQISVVKLLLEEDVDMLFICIDLIVPFILIMC